MTVHVNFESTDGDEIETDWGDVPIPHVGATISLCVCTDYAPPGLWDVEPYKTRRYKVVDVRFSYETHYSKRASYRTFVDVVLEKL